ncbi:hypothetical protein MMC17_004067 [Xylographa soralifera]|nr:hypothetical protein [Xylographa soralifera]
MAEVLGVVASGITIAGLAIQIASSVQQILDFWASMKGAPADIHNLLEELDLLAEILSSVDGNTDSTDHDETSLRQSATLKAARYCQNAASCIDAVVTDLSDGFAMPRGRRHWTAVKAVLKDKKMIKCLQRLERAKTMLSLAQQCYTQSQIRALEEFQRQKFQAIENLLKVPVSQHIVSPIAGREDSTSKLTNVAVASNVKEPHTKNKKAENVTYWLPLGTLIVRSKQSDQGQVDANEADVKHRDYEFRPRPWMFRRGFSVFSTQLYGFWQYSFRSYRIITMQDPIYAACVSGDLGTVQRLCSQGNASPFDRTSDGWTLLHVAAALADAKLCQWLIRQGLDGTLCGKFEGSYAVGDGAMSGLQTIFEPGSTLPKSSKISMLHGALAFMRQHYDGTQSSVRYAISLIRQLISSGIDLHEINSTRGESEETAIDVITALTVMIFPQSTEEIKRKVEVKAVSLFNLWLETLRDANVDVKKYLLEEARLALSKKERDVWSYGCHRCTHRVDWHVSLSEDEQGYSISIKYVKREEPIPTVDSNIPGGWVEDA